MNFYQTSVALLWTTALRASGLAQGGLHAAPGGRHGTAVAGVRVRTGGAVPDLTAQFQPSTEITSRAETVSR
jgi:hypothetical protein